jgi:DNA-binding NarL/FixJ family response regulator
MLWQLGGLFPIKNYRLNGYSGNMPTKIHTLLLADSHEYLRSVLRICLSHAQHIQIVGETTNGTDTMALVIRQSPDILLIAAHITNPLCLQVIRRLVALKVTTRILVISVDGYAPIATRIYQELCDGCIPHDAVVRDLVPAIIALSEGRKWGKENN